MELNRSEQKIITKYFPNISIRDVIELTLKHDEKELEIKTKEQTIRKKFLTMYSIDKISHTLLGGLNEY